MIGAFIRRGRDIKNACGTQRIRKGHVRIEGEVGHLQARESCPKRNQNCTTLLVSFCLQSCEKYLSIVEASQFVVTRMTALPHGDTVLFLGA